MKFYTKEERADLRNKQAGKGKKTICQACLFNMHHVCTEDAEGFVCCCICNEVK